MPSSGRPTGHVNIAIAALHRYDFSKDLLSLHWRVASAGCITPQSKDGS
jgi:hypothetical protein